MQEQNAVHEQHGRSLKGAEAARHPCLAADDTSSHRSAMFTPVTTEVRRLTGAEPAVLSPHVLQLPWAELKQPGLVAASLWAIPDPEPRPS